VNQASGKKVVSFSIATSRRYRDANGEQKEDTQWHNIVGFGKLADIFEQLGIRKGTSLYVEGRLTNRSWTDQASGQKRYVTEVLIDSFQILTPRGTQNGNGYGQQTQQQRPAYQNEYDQQQADDCEDLPF
jgi:single-strand DNA-binding protein